MTHTLETMHIYLYSTVLNVLILYNVMYNVMFNCMKAKATSPVKQAVTILHLLLKSSNFQVPSALSIHSIAKSTTLTIHLLWHSIKHFQSPNGRRGALLFGTHVQAVTVLHKFQVPSSLNIHSIAQSKTLSIHLLWYSMQTVSKPKWEEGWSYTLAHMYILASKAFELYDQM